MAIPGVNRVDPPRLGDERTQLDAWLDFHRVTLLIKCAGLSPQQLKMRAAEPSALTLLGLHMIEEYARHNGHADILRERIDGATGV